MKQISTPGTRANSSPVVCERSPKIFFFFAKTCGIRNEQKKIRHLFFFDYPLCADQNFKSRYAPMVPQSLLYNVCRDRSVKHLFSSHVIDQSVCRMLRNHIGHICNVCQMVPNVNVADMVREREREYSLEACHFEVQSLQEFLWPAKIQMTCFLCLANAAKINFVACQKETIKRKRC